MYFIIKSVFKWFCITNLVTNTVALTKIWKHNKDINDGDNWLNGQLQDDCDGLSFDSTSSYPDIVIDHLTVTNITLPLEGNLHLLDGALIKFEEYSIMNCVRVKIDVPNGNWMQPDNWIIQGDEDNAAIPHKERVPCRFDDVVFPKGWKSSTCSLDHFEGFYTVDIKSLKFGNDSLKRGDLREVAYAPIDIFEPFPYIFITNQECTDTTGCGCYNEEVNEAVCAYVESDANLRCLEAIKPTGFCTKMCGASIVFKPTANFRIDDIRELIKGYSSDTYVSKVRDTDYDVIQIVFAEKEFRGISVAEGKQFYSHLLADENLGASHIQLYSSSSYIPEGDASRTLSIVFGSLCGVVMAFAVIFFMYSPQEPVVCFRDRLRFPSRPLSSFTTNFFAKFENTEQEGLIIGDAQSLGGSIVSLDKSFDNPMYGKSSPSTASTSYDTVASADMKITKSEISVENPMYDLNKMADDVDEVGEEGELIDLEKK